MHYSLTPLKSQVLLQKRHLVLGKGIALLILAIALLSSCTQDHQPDHTPYNIRPVSSTKPVWGPTITPQSQAIIEELVRLNPTPLDSLTPAVARTKPTVKDAVASLLQKNGFTLPDPGVEVSQLTMTNGLRAVMYKPRNTTGTLPIIVYYHGGGWVIASPEVYEASAMALAKNVGAIVVSVDYRLAPENKFPTAHNDAYAAYKWVKKMGHTISGDTTKVAVAGESAGGNMAVTVSMMARDSGLAMPVHQLAVYPVANNDLTTESYKQYGMSKPLSKSLVEWFVMHYFNTMADGDKPQISLVDKANLSGLPPITIIAAEIDPLQTEGKQLADKFDALKIKVDYRLYTGVTHEFFGTYVIEPKAQEAQLFAASQLRAAFGK